MRDYRNIVVVDKMPRPSKYKSLHDIIERDETLSFDQKYDELINYLGGLDAVAQYVPFSKERIETALNKGDDRLNTLPMTTWNTAAGFRYTRQDRRERISFVPSNSNLWGLFMTYGITSASPSQCVCLLKRAAVRMVEERKDGTHA